VNVRIATQPDSIGSLDLAITHAFDALPSGRDRATRTERAARCARLADLYRRRAAVWHQLAVDGYADPSVPPIYGRAASESAGQDLTASEGWDRRATEWSTPARRA
jgi:hypothetical protein